MHRIVFLYFLVLVFLTNCTNSISKPTNLLPKDTIVQIIAEMHINDALVISPKVQNYPKKINSEKLYNAILTRHNITNKIFEDNLNYLSCDTTQFRLIYDEVITLLSIKQGNIQNQVNTDKE